MDIINVEISLVFDLHVIAANVSLKSHFHPNLILGLAQSENGRAPFLACPNVHALSTESSEMASRQTFSFWIGEKWEQKIH